MATANDDGVRPGILTTEFLTFAMGGVFLILNGTSVINIPWDTLTGYLALGGVYMGGRALQKTVGTFSSGKAANNQAVALGGQHGTNIGERNVT